MAIISLTQRAIVHGGELTTEQQEGLLQPCRRIPSVPMASKISWKLARRHLHRSWSSLTMPVQALIFSVVKIHLQPQNEVLAQGFNLVCMNRHRTAGGLPRMFLCFIFDQIRQQTP